MEMNNKCFPLLVSGIVVKGFGRGSKELGIPTANLCEKVVEALPKELNTGIYFGLASVDHGPVQKMVVSIGWNPFYKNEKKSMEVHVLHNFDQDFYGSFLKAIVLGFIRPERSYPNVDELIKAIWSDIKTSKTRLDESSFAPFFHHPFWTEKPQEDSASSSSSSGKVERPEDRLSSQDDFSSRNGDV